MWQGVILVLGLVVFEGAYLLEMWGGWPHQDVHKSKLKEEEKKQESACLALGAGMDVLQFKNLGAREIGQLS